MHGKRATNEHNNTKKTEHWNSFEYEHIKWFFHLLLVKKKYMFNSAACTKSLKAFVNIFSFAHCCFVWTRDRETLCLHLVKIVCRRVGYSALETWNLFDEKKPETNTWTKSKRILHFCIWNRKFCLRYSYTSHTICLMYTIIWFVYVLTHFDGWNTTSNNVSQLFNH